MSIEYLEIRNQNFQIAGICDVFKSVIWRAEYYGTGDFEIYAPVSPVNLALLIEDNFVTRPNDENVGVIESVEYTFDVTNGRMIVAAGRFAKSILDRRVTIANMTSGVPVPYELSGSVSDAARQLVETNAINCSFDSSRNIPNFILGEYQSFNPQIVDENGNSTKIQTFLDNLLMWTDELLKNYKLGAVVRLNAGNLEYHVVEGKNRAVDNEDGNNPVIFSQDFENLISSDYKEDKKNFKNYAIIGGEQTGSTRYYAMTTTTQTGFARREIFFDGSKTTRTKGSTTISTTEYKNELRAIAVQRLVELAKIQTFSGEINLNSLTFKYKTDYNIGDIVTIQDSDTKIFTNVRILEITEVQDDNGSTLSGKYESV